MDDEWIETGPALGFEHFGDRPTVGRIRAQPVNRLGWKGDQCAACQKSGGFVNIRLLSG